MEKVVFSIYLYKASDAAYFIEMVQERKARRYAKSCNSLCSIYEVDDEFRKMYEEWLYTQIDKDGNISGVFADYIEEHLPSDNFIEACLKYLRGRFHSPKNNQNMV